MQHQTKNTFSQRRFRFNKMATFVVTFFGWLVLVLFVLLISHIVVNALPLTYTPKISFIKSTPKPNFDIDIGSVSMNDQIALIGINDCSIKQVMQNIEGEFEVSQSFNIPCGKTSLSVTADDVGIGHYLTMDKAGLIELFRVSQQNRKLSSTRFASFFAPQQVANAIISNPIAANAEILNDTIYIWYRVGSNMQVLQQQLSTTDEPSVHLFLNTNEYFPLAFPRHHLMKGEKAVLIMDSQHRILQTIDTKINASVVRLPGAKGFLIFEQGAYTAYGLYNHQGRFEYTPIIHQPFAETGNALAIDYDTRTGILFTLTDQQQVLIINPHTLELVSSQQVTFDAHSLYVVENMLVIGTQSRLERYDLQNVAGITTWSSLFAPVKYIGYAQPEYIWQSSRAQITDQAKFSLIPLIIGSIKASLLSLLVAVPLSIGAAVFTAYFASERARNWIKPGIEMIEAVPAVVIGFVAAVWLAPIAEKYLVALLVTLMLLPLAVAVVIVIHSMLLPKLTKTLPQNIYVMVAIIIFFIGLLMLFNVGIYAQQVSIAQSNNLVHDFMATVSISRSTLIVALALGLAITPTVFSLIDDAIHEVPRGAILAAFALGATELQTLSRVVLVVAFPSIIAAVMLGLGRAFGETMIVLMVTGNTPLPDWDLLSGLRTLTSNLAIELQESSKGTAHFNIMFFTAALLFLFTFMVNTIASLIKAKMAKRNSND